jgi:hypothetical protein
VTTYQSAAFPGDWVVTVPAEVNVGAGDTARVLVHVCGPEAVNHGCQVTTATTAPPGQTGSTITAQLSSRDQVAIDSRSTATQMARTKADSLTWEWLATPDAIGQLSLSLTVTATGSSAEAERTMTIPVNAYRFENHCRAR